MDVRDPHLPWNDPQWAEASDNRWQAPLRQHQAWWRQERLGLPAGPIVGGTRLVSSMLPDDVGLAPNLMWPEAEDAARKAIESLAAESRPGLIQEERLRRNLLSSQPLCFNLFGYLGAHRDALLPWVRTIRPGAVSVEDVRLEWAPSVGTVAGSAFDAFISYRNMAGAPGFLGIEVKYAEDLAQAQRKPASDKFKGPTTAGPWRPDAVEQLDRPKLRQFWYNQLLTQVVLASGQFAEGTGVVVACAADRCAQEVAAAVAAQLQEPSDLRFSSIEDVVASVSSHDAWQESFGERYLSYSETAAQVGTSQR